MQRLGHIWLVFLPWLVAGLIFVAELVADIETSPNGMRCTNITRVCSVVPTLPTYRRATKFGVV